MLRREAGRNEELLRKKDEELLHQRGPSPALSHSQGDEHDVVDMYKRRDRKQPPPHEERKQSTHKKRTVYPPHKRNRREE
nr:hypothetical protein CFP56_41221 [Quercus suber]